MQESYRADIDGLRAVAVAAVVLFHARLGVPGGFTGVDVFFVISGYLITRIIRADIADGSFSLVKFWERRARRIFPALAAVVVACLGAGYFLLLPFGLEVLGQTVLTLVGLSSNIFFWQTNHYFSASAKENPLLHTWSLSVEEQYYLLYPLLLCFLLARGRRFAFVGLASICAASFLCSIFWLRIDSSGAFYMLPSRAWELGLGALVALGSNRTGRLWREGAAWTGLALIVGSFFVYTKHTPFPGWAALPPVAGTALIIWAGVGAENGKQLPLVSRLLSAKALVGIGLLSYSLYLWHWPFFAFHRYLQGQPPSFFPSIAYVACAVVLSVASYQWIEQPIRRRVLLSSRRGIFALWLAGSALLAVIGVVLAKTDGAPWRLSEGARDLATANGQKLNALFGESSGEDGSYKATLGQKDAAMCVFVWGDSQAMTLAPAFDQAGKELGVRVEVRARPGTAPVENWKSAQNGTRPAFEMQAFNEGAREEIRALQSEGVLLGVVFVLKWCINVVREPALEEWNPPAGFAEALGETVASLRRHGVSVAVFEESPVFEIEVPKALALHEFLGTAPLQRRSEDVDRFRAVYAPVRKALPADIVLVDPAPSLVANDGFVRLKSADGLVLFSDQNHLSPAGARELAPLVKDVIRKLESISQ
ncbi:MAG: acyltransferase family protein [Sphaerospermopsis kisseleviana]